MGWKRSLLRRLPVFSRLGRNLDALEEGNRRLQDRNRKLEEANRQLADANRRLLSDRPLQLNANTYEKLYETLAINHPGDEAVGGDFHRIGRIERAILQQEGLRPTHTLVDFGCGIGRLAMYVIPFLKGGNYIGIDISTTMLERARKEVARNIPDSPCFVSWLHQTTARFQVPERSVDIVCAFSVFTHMEHEDAYRYLLDARRIVRPGGRFIFSCLPLDLEDARRLFAMEARRELAERWSSVRNITTSVDLMSRIARMAGWNVLGWHRGDVACFQTQSGEAIPLGQSVCVLESPAD